MRVLPDVGPRPRLLASAVTTSDSAASEGIPVPKYDTLGKRLFRTVVRILLVASVASGVAYWLVHRDLIHEESGAIRRVVRVGTHRLSGDRHSSRPEPIVVELNENLIQVSTIALGHPRLAIINGKQVAEGDTITVHAPTRSIAVTLRVVEIADREVKLSDGTQIIVAHLTRPSAK